MCKTTEEISQALEPLVQTDQKNKLLTMPPMIPGGLLQARKPRTTVATGAATTRSTTTTTTTMRPKSTGSDAPLTAAQIADLSASLLKLKTKSEQSTFIDTFRRRNFY